MRWFLGHTAGVEGVSWEEFRARACEPHLVFGGALHEGIEQADQRLARFLPALLRDFSTGWSAVAFAVRSRQPALFGPLAAPTTARGLTRAPLGFYMLSARRLADSLPSAPLEAQRQALAIHTMPTTGSRFSVIQISRWSATCRVGNWSIGLLASPSACERPGALS